MQSVGDHQYRFLKNKNPNMGSQLGFPLCRCRYEQEMNHDGPSSVWSSSPPQSSSGWSARKNKRRVHLATITHWQDLYTELKRRSSLCLEYAVTLGDVAIAVEVKTYFLFIFYVFIPIYLHLGRCTRSLLMGSSRQESSASSLALKKYDLCQKTM